MSDPFFNLNVELDTELNGIQPVTDDFFTSGQLDQNARIDHQHPLSETLRAAIFNSTLYVKKSGDTMTGGLTITSANITLTAGNALILAPASAASIYYVSSPSSMPWYTGIRLQVADGFSVYTNVSGDILGYRGIAGTGYFWNSAKALFGSAPSDSLVTQVLNVNGNINILGTSALGWVSYQASAIWMQDASWVRAQPNFYTAGIVGGDGGLSVRGGGSLGGFNAYIVGILGVTSTAQALGVISTRNMGAGGYSNASFWANPGAGNASISLHCGGVAPILYCANGAGNNFYHRDSIGNTGSANCIALAYLGDSSRRWKKNINDWPLKNLGAASESAIDLIIKLRIVSWQKAAKDIEVPHERRRLALEKLNRIRASKDEPDYELPEHDCIKHNCVGTADDPCIRTRDNERERIGLIAEEVHEVVPSVVHLDADKIPAQIDIGQLAILALAGLQELIERVKELEAA